MGSFGIFTILRDSSGEEGRREEESNIDAIGDLLWRTSGAVHFTCQRRRRRQILSCSKAVNLINFDGIVAFEIGVNRWRWDLKTL